MTHDQIDEAAWLLAKAAAEDQVASIAAGVPLTVLDGEPPTVSHGAETVEISTSSQADGIVSERR